MLQYMMEKEYKFDYLIGEQNTEKNLLDVCYEQLVDSAEITVLNKSSGMFKQICAYVENTQLLSKPSDGSLRFVNPGAFEIAEVFEVTRHEEELLYGPFETNFNRQLLFHVRLCCGVFCAF